jgi:hypothetical protein
LPGGLCRGALAAGPFAGTPFAAGPLPEDLRQRAVPMAELGDRRVPGQRSGTVFRLQRNDFVGVHLKGTGALVWRGPAAGRPALIG